MEDLKLRTIKNLAEKKGRVYVYLANKEIGEKFMSIAEKEGFTFGDGVPLSEKRYARVIAVNHNYTLNYINGIGLIAFGAGAKEIGDEELIRVDFEKYIAGDEDYNFNGKH